MTEIKLKYYYLTILILCFKMSALFTVTFILTMLAAVKCNKKKTEEIPQKQMGIIKCIERVWVIQVLYNGISENHYKKIRNSPAV